MELIRASAADFPKIAAYYRFVIDNTENMAACCRWIYGLHPTDALLQGYINDGAMYYTERNGEILSAAAVTMRQGDEYHLDCWGAALSDEQVAAVHILGVNPRYPRQGIAKDTMAAIERLAAENGKRAIRLDSLLTNKPAHAMYRSIGFSIVAEKRWYAANTGFTDFVLFEKLL